MTTVSTKYKPPTPKTVPTNTDDAFSTEGDTMCVRAGVLVVRVVVSVELGMVVGCVVLICVWATDRVV